MPLFLVGQKRSGPEQENRSTIIYLGRSLAEIGCQAKDRIIRYIDRLAIVRTRMESRP